MTRDLAIRHVAAALDYPNIIYGTPSPQSMRRADYILKTLEELGIIRYLSSKEPQSEIL
jgi:hypothetical protein